MIGPHEGRELELMLQGFKPLAAFSDIIPENGQISEDIIPENQFKPYVENRRIFRLCSEFKSGKGPIRLVCFTLPDEFWRAHSYTYLRKKIHAQKIEYTNTLDEIFGHLLGYSDKDISEFK